MEKDLIHRRGRRGFGGIVKLHGAVTEHMDCTFKPRPSLVTLCFSAENSVAINSSYPLASAVEPFCKCSRIANTPWGKR